MQAKQAQGNTTDTSIKRRETIPKKARCCIKDSHQQLHYPDFNSINCSEVIHHASSSPVKKCMGACKRQEWSQTPSACIPSG
ncbi:hypothetical protein OPV22_016744 [Ensete ventricosum]|uniref:Uncharacterized protein n=1 Tax=Ensete ventricosum TaxID=4639 RepID=A0AAV8R0I1_ENSVE|nr:hypothetical protein OPV22_016744 [Ensete ventricosum]